MDGENIVGYWVRRKFLMKFKKLYNDEELQEELHNMSIEDIMKDGGFSREVATAIYEAEHGIDMEEVTLEQLLWEIHNI